MKSSILAILWAAIVALAAQHAAAQLTQPTSARPISLSAEYYVQDDDAPAPSNAQPSPSDIPVPGDEPEVEDQADDGGHVVCYDGPVHLFNEVHGIQIGGWLNGGYYNNGDGVDSGTGNLPVNFPSLSDGAQMNQAWIYAEKCLPEDCCGNGFGYRVDYVFGTDGPDTQAFGDENWDNRWDSSRDYGSAMPQLYFEYGNSKTSVKAGHFFTIIGYEVVPAPENFFYSHSYTLVYAEPFTHTGVMVSHQVNDQIAVSGGYTMGWDSGFSNANDAATFLGSVAWSSCDDRMNVIYAVNFGDFGDGEILDDPGVVGNNGDIYMHSIVGIYRINECMEYVVQHDYFNNSDAATANDPNRPNTITAGGINQYLFWTMNSCMKFGLRFEWFNDDDGARVVTNDATYAGGDFYATTVGVNYTPTSNVIIRPEVRYDTFHGTGQPFADGTKRDQFFYGLDVILMF